MSTASAIAVQLVTILDAITGASATKTGYDILEGTAQHCFVVMPPSMDVTPLSFSGDSLDEREDYDFTVEGYIRDNGNPVDFFEQQYAQIEAVRAAIRAESTLNDTVDLAYVARAERAPNEWNIGGVLWQEIDYTIRCTVA